MPRTLLGSARQIDIGHGHSPLSLMRNSRSRVHLICRCDVGLPSSFSGKGVTIVSLYPSQLGTVAGPRYTHGKYHHADAPAVNELIIASSPVLPLRHLWGGEDGRSTLSLSMCQLSSTRETLAANAHATSSQRRRFWRVQNPRS